MAGTRMKRAPILRVRTLADNERMETERPMRAMILAHDFPPLVSVGGQRPYSWLRYLGEFGVTPVVVTRQWANTYGDERDYVAPSRTRVVEVEESTRGTVLRAPYRPNLSHRLLLEHGPRRFRLVRKSITAWYEIGQYYAPIGPKVGIYRAARDYLRATRVDAIVATGEPFVLFDYASRLSREFHVPWIADYRDAWSQNRNRAAHFVSRKWAESVERRATASASAIVTVADALVHVLGQIHGDGPIAVIPNGYDPESMAAAQTVEQDREHLTLGFVGTIYRWHPVEGVFRALDDFVTANPEAPFHIRMIGTNQAAVEAMLTAQFPALAPRVTFTGRLPNAEAVVELARAHALLAFNNYAYPGTKIYEYLALGRRILLCYTHDEEARTLRRKYYNLDSTGVDDRMHERMVEGSPCGVAVADGDHLRRVLDDLLAEFLRHRRIVCDPGDNEQHSRRAKTAALAELIREVAG